MLSRTVFLALVASAHTQKETAKDTAVGPMSEEAFLRKWAGVVQRVDVDDLMVEAEGAHPVRVLQGGNPFDLLLQALQKIAGTWQSIVNAFKSTYSEQIADKEFANGWSQFKEGTKVFKGAGLPGPKTDEFFQDIQGVIGLPTKYSADFQKQIEWIKFFDNVTWSQHNTQFATGKGGTDTMFSMFAKNRQDTSDKMDVLFMTCAQQFKLADNYFVISQHKSILGGLFDTTKLKMKKIPAGITDAELTFVSDYFSLLAYQQVALAEGASAPPDPNFPPSAPAA